MDQIWLWVGFNAFVVAMLALDLGVFHKKAHVIKIKEALLLSAFWIALALVFNVGVYFVAGKHKALEFLTGYLIEKSLSVDNLFVFLLIFNFFKVPHIHQHKALFWGILGAIILRGLFILTGVTLVQKFHWLLYIFGAFLIYTGVKLAFEKDKEVHPEKSFVTKLFRRIFPVTNEFHEDKFFVRIDGKFFVTPLFLVLNVINVTDVIFAMDSIPAIFAITLDPFIVYASNIFAILGLRALYFAISGVMRLFHHLHYGLSFILSFVGLKMLVADFYHIPIGAALGVIAGVLVLSVIASLVWPRKHHPHHGGHPPSGPPHAEG
ncbi:MAG: TerC family protein [Candidatus Omnitrophota bacterium]